VLLVDDDATTNKTAVFALEQAGFQVTVVGHGPDAVKYFHQAVPEIHLAIVSAVFPGLPGRELAGILRGLQPGLPVLYVCGRFDVPAGWPADERAWPLLLKPFRAEELLKRVEALLPEKGR
jgi:DNA-binding response OmpR family regulator